MITDDSTEALARIDSPDNLVNKLRLQGSNVEIRDRFARNTQKKNLPPMIQTLAVASGIVDGQATAGKTFGVSQPDISYLTREGKGVNRDQVKQTVSDVHQQALDGMLTAIGLLGPKLHDVKKATDLSRVAADLSRVVNNTSPKEGPTTNVKVVVFSPVIRGEEQYEEIVVPS